ncbi:MAG TPA: hypothetical protein VHF88_06275 [Thermoleophilaceae bacterium]|nr:hypothetical protein [Thermoleophilaceae bacterium]
MNDDDSALERSVEEAMAQQELDAVRELLATTSGLFPHARTPDEMQRLVDRLETEEGQRDELERIKRIVEATPQLREVFERVVSFQRFHERP